MLALDVTRALSTHSKLSLFFQTFTYIATGGATTDQSSSRDFSQAFLNGAELVGTGIALYIVILLVRRRGIGNPRDSQRKLQRRITVAGGSDVTIIALAPRLRSFVWRYRLTEMRWTLRSLLRRHDEWLITVTRGTRVIRQEIVLGAKAQSRVEEIAHEMAEGSK